MNLENIRNYCLEKNGSSEDFPFDETTLVFRVGGKIFALTDTDEYPLRINLKCAPERAAELREEYDFILPGWHMNKKHWNTIILEAEAEPALIMELIDHSYELVYASLTKKVKADLEKQKTGIIIAN